MLNHRERRQEAKRDAKKLTCREHNGVRLMVKGTQTICPQCYLDYVTAKKRAKFGGVKNEQEIAQTPSETE